MQIFPTRMCNVTAWRHSRLRAHWLIAPIFGWGGGGWGRSMYSAFLGNCSVSYFSFVCGRSLTAGKILFTGRQTCSLYLVLYMTLYGCYGYFFWEAEFNDKCKNQGYNENHVCNISNFSKIDDDDEFLKNSKYCKYDFHYCLGFYIYQMTLCFRNFNQALRQYFSSQGRRRWVYKSLVEGRGKCLSACTHGWVCHIGGGMRKQIFTTTKSFFTRDSQNNEWGVYISFVKRPTDWWKETFEIFSTNFYFSLVNITDK